MKTATILLLIAASAFSEDAKPPQVTDAQKIVYFKTQAKMVSASAQYQAAQTALTAAIDAIQKACQATPGFQASVGPDEEPMCQAKPKEAVTPKPEVKKPEVKK